VVPGLVRCHWPLRDVEGVNRGTVVALSCLRIAVKMVSASDPDLERSIGEIQTAARRLGFPFSSFDSNEV
jgi:hypothetical protein